MQRLVLSVLASATLVACAPEVPDSARGVGFESYSDYMNRRETGAPPPQARASVPISPERPMASMPSRPLAPQPTTALAPVAAAPVATSPIAPAAPLQPQSGGRISDEQNFDAVASRESIESDRQRIQQNRQQYVVVQPTEVPQAAGPVGPNIVEFAISTRHNPGTPTYPRATLFRKNYEAACAPFTSSDLAQEAFLAAGGPERDKLGVDPDGDGFACGWDPRPFRAAMR